MACKDCSSQGITTNRPAPHPGPRCTTHHRAFKAAQKTRNHARHVESTYGITGEQYDQLLAFQGGHCAICLRATGKTKKLAVDHRHSDGEVRGILCSVDNRYIGHLRDDPEALRRAADYLENPPARQLFKPTKGTDQ